MSTYRLNALILSKTKQKLQCNSFDDDSEVSTEEEDGNLTAFVYQSQSFNPNDPEDIRTNKKYDDFNDEMFILRYL